MKKGREGFCLFTFVVIVLTYLLVGSSLSIEWKDCCVINRTTRRLLLPSATG